jgi:macrophage erythroblast attacher
VKRDGAFVKDALKDAATGAVNGKSSQEDVLKALDSMILRMRGLKRKLTACADEETRLFRQEDARVRHLAELYGMNSVEDVKYEVWSRTRLDRLLVDYMLRQGYTDSARMLAEERGIESLCDVETFEQMNRIRDSLRNGSVTEA